MRVVSKSKLKANMLEIFREIEASGEELIVTHHNQPVLRITPIAAGESVEAVMGELRGQVRYHADINEPTVDEWGDV
jgi:antitoxin (DNA-binding transcriptional repressor) of toxin-antitoxin stability system